MTYPFRYEDEGIDIQRMPGTHTPARTDPIAVHTPDHPFCLDPDCSCKSNQEALERVQQWVRDGLMTPEEASDYCSGRTF